MEEYISSDLVDLEFTYSGYISSDLVDLSFLKDVQASDLVELIFNLEQEKYISSDLVDLEFESLDTISIFDTQLKCWKLYGIITNSRKPKQTQNITQGFKVSTLIEYIDFEYECTLQWLTKGEKESVVSYIKSNNGLKIKILKSLFYDYEGGEIKTSATIDYVVVLANYEDISVTNKSTGFFDIKLKLKTVETYNIQ